MRLGCVQNRTLLENCQSKCFLHAPGEPPIRQVGTTFDELNHYVERQVSLLSEGALKLLRQHHFLSPFAVELAFKLARLKLAVGDGKAVVQELSAGVAIARDCDLGALESARVLQAASVVCNRAGMWRKGAYFATWSSRALSAVQDWKGSVLAAVLAECTLWGICRPKRIGWLLLRVCAAERALSSARHQGDLHVILLLGNRLLRLLDELCVNKREVTRFGPGGVCMSTAGDDYLNSTEDRRAWLDALEASMINLPDDMCRKATVSLQPYILSLRLSSMNTCGLIGLPRMSDLGPLTPVASSTSPLFFSPFNRFGQSTVPLGKEDSQIIWAVGERSSVKVELQNEINVALHLHSAKLVCCGLRCVCHDLSHAEVLTAGSLLNLRTARLYTLFVTPLEAGILEIVGVLLRTSTYVTTTTVLLKERHHCAFVPDRGRRFLARIQHSCGKSQLEESGCDLSTAGSGNRVGHVSVRITAPLPKVVASIQFAPYGAATCSPFGLVTSTQPSGTKKFRDGECLALYLTMANTSAIPLCHLEVWTQTKMTRAKRRIFIQINAINATDCCCIQIDPTSAEVGHRVLTSPCVHQLRDLIQSNSTSVLTLICSFTAISSSGVLHMHYSDMLRPTRIIAMPYTLQVEAGVEISHVIFRIHDSTTCAAYIQMRNNCHNPVLVWYQDRTFMLRGNEHNTNLVLMIPRQCFRPDAMSLARSLLYRIGWRFDGSANSSLDGAGWLRPLSSVSYLNTQSLCIDTE